MATLNIAELATTLDASPREVRKFLRSVTPVDEQPGKGGRWAIEKRQVRSLTKQYAAWRDERETTPEVPNDDMPDAQAPEGRNDIEELETE